MSQTSWWGRKVRQFAVHLGARVSRAERAAIAAWTTPGELRLFDSMHVADRRHGLDVVASLRDAGVGERDVLVAGLLHDCGKGDVGVWPRVLHSLGQAWGRWIGDLAGRAPGVGPRLRPALERLRNHPELSAQLAAEAGCGPRVVDLIRYQEAPRDPEYGELLRLADEAN